MTAAVRSVHVGGGGGGVRKRTLHNKSGPGVLGFCVSTPAGGLPTTATAAAVTDDITQRAPGFYFFSLVSFSSLTLLLLWGGFKPLCPHSLHAHKREKHTHTHTYILHTNSLNPPLYPLPLEILRY